MTLTTFLAQRLRLRTVASLLSLAALGITTGLLLGKLYLLWPALS